MLSMLKFKRLLLVMTAIALVSVSCAAATPQMTVEKVVQQVATSGERSLASGQPAAPSSHIAADQAAGNTKAVDRIILKNANLSIYVENPGQSMDRIGKMADEMGGFVVSANMYQSTLSSGVEVPHASITIRVPAARLDEALAQIKKETTQPVLNESISSQDVTSDYTDLQSRLRNQEAAEAQLKEIMGSATKTEDVMNVFNQLSAVREQIEVLKGQIQYYEQSAALSAINIDLTANAAIQLPLTIGRWQPVGVAKSAIQALINTLKFLVEAAIWIILYIAPVLFVISLPVILIVGLLRGWRARRKAKKAAKVVEPPAEVK